MTTIQPPARRAGRHRLAAAATLALAFGLTAVAAPAQAGRPVGGCPSDLWMSTTLPAHGADTTSLLWVLTLEGLVEEFGSTDAALDAFGLPSLDALAGVTTAGALQFDKNGDGVLCMKDQPDTPGFPAYLFNGTDNTSHSR